MVSAGRPVVGVGNQIGRQNGVYGVVKWEYPLLRTKKEGKMGENMTKNKREGKMEGERWQKEGKIDLGGWKGGKKKSLG